MRRICSVYHPTEHQSPEPQICIRPGINESGQHISWRTAVDTLRTASLRQPVTTATISGEGTCTRPGLKSADLYGVVRPVERLLYEKVKGFGLSNLGAVSSGFGRRYMTVRHQGKGRPQWTHITVGQNTGFHIQHGSNSDAYHVVQNATRDRCQRVIFGTQCWRTEWNLTPSHRAPREEFGQIRGPDPGRAGD